MKRPYKLLMSGFGNLFIAKETSKPGIMSMDRFEVPESEFLQIVEMYTKHKLESGSDTLEVKAAGKLVMEIKIIS